MSSTKRAANAGCLSSGDAGGNSFIHSDGKFTTKAQEIDNIKSSTLKWASVDIHERKIRVYGDTAVVISLASSNGTLGGKPYSGDFRTTQFWVKHKGNWEVRRTSVNASGFS